MRISGPTCASDFKQRSAINQIFLWQSCQGEEAGGKPAGHGLNEVALLDIIANPPVSVPDGGAWISALAMATGSTTAMASTLNRRLPERCDVGNWVWSSGAVVGGYEFQRGAGCPQELGLAEGIRDWKTLTRWVRYARKWNEV